MNKVRILFLILCAVIALAGCQQYSLQTEISQLTEISSVKNTANNFAVVSSIKNVKYWNNIELIKATDTGINPEKIHYRGRHRDQDIVKCFGSNMPSSVLFCLHDAGRPDSLKYKIPVLLIHGANTNATRAWADPDGNGKRTGLVQYLKNQGYWVFAVTFANKHGDNFIWSSHIQRAISRIQQVTGEKKVDAIGHSKGGFALRLYVSGINEGNQVYHNDIRKAVFIGTPHRGIDYTFRHPVVHWGIYSDNDDPVKYAPLAWTKLLWQGAWRNSEEMSFLGEYFPGQTQMLARWDKIYPLPVTEQDWYTTYNGGQGLVSVSPGIDEAISKGGNLVKIVKKSPVNSEVKIANLAGKSPDIPGIFNELSGPSDGIIFLSSANATGDLTGLGAKLLSDKVMNLNHLELVSHPDAMKWIAGQLENN